MKLSKNKIVKMAKLPRLEHAVTLYSVASVTKKIVKRVATDNRQNWDNKHTLETCLVKSWSKSTVYCLGGFPLRLL